MIMKKRSLIAKALMLVMVLSLFQPFGVLLPSSVKAEALFKIGSYVSFGEVDGEPIIWRVGKIDEDGVLIIEQSALEEDDFDVAEFVEKATFSDAEQSAVNHDVEGITLSDTANDDVGLVHVYDFASVKKNIQSGNDYDYIEETKAVKEVEVEIGDEEDGEEAEEIEIIIDEPEYNGGVAPALYLDIDTAVEFEGIGSSRAPFEVVATEETTDEEPADDEDDKDATADEDEEESENDEDADLEDNEEADDEEEEELVDDLWELFGPGEYGEVGIGYGKGYEDGYGEPFDNGIFLREFDTDFAIQFALGAGTPGNIAQGGRHSSWAGYYQVVSGAAEGTVVYCTQGGRNGPGTGAGKPYQIGAEGSNPYSGYGYGSAFPEPATLSGKAVSYSGMSFSEGLPFIYRIAMKRGAKNSAEFNNNVVGLAIHFWEWMCATPGSGRNFEGNIRHYNSFDGALSVDATGRLKWNGGMFNGNAGWPAVDIINELVGYMEKGPGDYMSAASAAIYSITPFAAANNGYRKATLHWGVNYAKLLPTKDCLNVLKDQEQEFLDYTYSNTRDVQEQFNETGGGDFTQYVTAVNDGNVGVFITYKNSGHYFEGINVTFHGDSYGGNFWTQGYIDVEVQESVYAEFISCKPEFWILAESSEMATQTDSHFPRFWHAETDLDDGESPSDSEVQIMTQLDLQKILVPATNGIPNSTTIEFKKVNEDGEALEGAEFELHYIIGDKSYKASIREYVEMEEDRPSEGAAKFTAYGEWSEPPADAQAPAGMKADTVVTPASGIVFINNLAESISIVDSNGEANEFFINYYLVETKAPKGYGKGESHANGDLPAPNWHIPLGSTANLFEIENGTTRPGLIFWKRDTRSLEPIRAATQPEIDAGTVPTFELHWFNEETGQWDLKETVKITDGSGSYVNESIEAGRWRITEIATFPEYEICTPAYKEVEIPPGEIVEIGGEDNKREAFLNVSVGHLRLTKRDEEERNRRIGKVTFKLYYRKATDNAGTKNPVAVKLNGDEKSGRYVYDEATDTGEFSADSIYEMTTSWVDGYEWVDDKNPGEFYKEHKDIGYIYVEDCPVGMEVINYQTGEKDSRYYWFEEIKVVAPWWLPYPVETTKENLIPDDFCGEYGCTKQHTWTEPTGTGRAAGHDTNVLNYATERIIYINKVSVGDINIDGMEDRYSLNGAEFQVWSTRQGPTYESCDARYRRTLTTRYQMDINGVPRNGVATNDPKNDVYRPDSVKNHRDEDMRETPIPWDRDGNHSVMTFRVKEVEAPPGHTINQQLFTLELPWSNQYDQYIYGSVTVAETQKLTQIRVEKLDALTGQSARTDFGLEGAEFYVIRDRRNPTNGFDPLSEWDICPDEFKDIIVCGDSRFGISKKLPLGYYTLWEKTPPKYYDLAPGFYPINAAEEHMNETLVLPEVIRVEDTLKPGRISIFKFFKDFDKVDRPLEGIRFEIRDKSSGQVKQTIETDEYGFAISEEPSTDIRDVEKQLWIGNWYVIREVTTNSGWESLMYLDTSGWDHDKMFMENGELHVFLENEERVHFDIENRQRDTTVRITKRDSETGNIVLKPGAKFVIKEQYSSGNADMASYVTMYDKHTGTRYYYVNESDYVPFVTNAQGYIDLPEMLPQGHYLLIEKEAPEGYELNNDPVEFSVSEADISAHLAYLASIEKLEKERANGTITAEDEKKLNDLYANPFRVEVSMYDSIIKRPIRVAKYADQLVGSTIAAYKEGMPYVDSYEEWLALDDHLKYQRDIYTPVYEYRRKKGVKFEVYAAERIVNADGVTVHYEKDDLVEELITGSDGTDKTQDLPIGRYYVVEVDPGEGHIINKDKEFVTITADDVVIENAEAIELLSEIDENDIAGLVPYLAIKNERPKNEVRIYKEYEVLQGDRAHFEPAAGVVFGLYAADAIKGVDSDEPVIPKDGALAILVTDENGRATSMTPKRNAAGEIIYNKYGIPEIEAGVDLPFAEYYVQEIVAPYGCEIDMKEYKVEFTWQGEEETHNVEEANDGKAIPNYEGKGVIEIIKYGEKMKAIDGAEFKIYEVINGEYGAEVDYLIVDKGVAKSKPLSWGDYVIREVKAAPGYQLDDTWYECTLSPDTDATRGIFNVLKVLDEKRVGVMISDLETPVRSRNVYIMDLEGNILKSLRTNLNGNTPAIILDKGSYKIQFEGSTKLFDMKLTTDEEIESSYTAEQTFWLPNNPTSVEITKYNADSLEELAGAWIEIKDSEGNFVGNKPSYQTNAQGKIKLARLEAGEYTFREVKAPDGYLLNPIVYKFEVDKYGKVTGNLSLPNDPIKAEIIKYETGTTKGVKGAKVQIRQSNDPLLEGELFQGQEYFVTDENGKIELSPIKPGRYTFEELEAPEGYVRTPVIFEFEVAEDGTITGETSFYNPKSTGGGGEGEGEEEGPKYPDSDLIISKSDLTDDKPVPGAKIEIFNEAGEKIFEGITDENGIIHFPYPPVGKYYFKETQAPSGYALEPQAFWFEITEEGIVKGTTHFNDDYARIAIVKKDGDTGGLLPGVEFGLYNTDGNIVMRGTTDENGALEFVGVQHGTYFVRELTPLPGYDGTHVFVSVEVDGTYVNTVPFEIPNVKPARTGNVNPVNWLLMILMLNSVILFMVRRKKAKETV